MSVTKTTIQQIPYSIGFYVVRTTDNVYIECNSMIMINQGATIATVDQMTIGPGESLSVPGELFEVMKHRWRVSFTGAGQNNLVVVFKYYL